MDDILVYSETYHRDGHAQYIEWTLGALRDAGFKIALETSEFFLSEISFLGYVVTRGGLRSDSRKVAAVKEALVPTSLTQVRAFLGLVPYYCDFIKGFAAIARPLTNLLPKDQPLQWDSECGQAFDALQEALVTAPVLIRPDPAKQFILITEWQPEAISAILVQKGNDGHEHVIEYASRTVPHEQRNDSAPQGECYAVVWGILHFHPYLYGQKFRLVTHHEPLLALKKLTNYTNLHGHDWMLGDRTASENEEVEIEEEEESSEEEEEKVEEEDAEEETPEEGSYSEHNEGEQSPEEEEEEEEDQEELDESEWEGFEEEVRTEAQAQAQAQKREEIAAEKRQLEFASAANQQLADNPAWDPEPPKPEDEDPTAETSAAPARRRRSRSPSPSTSARPPIRPRTDAGHQASSPVVIPPSP
ncbi:hypothetical protein CBR_g26422 [Chara braunii]|uniref:Reverse transcriptase domain-containing protein n=1 Tax=Chara braunii TaxID=69332 RepID=A0A388L804_CHABU|nr:hypothetical protein CBR_g26422 [Chara braunii]|eukprot:GBG78394.1 hypothetical protein CBR_g26422 [Chara braunii]